MLVKPNLNPKSFHIAQSYSIFDNDYYSTKTKSEKLLTQPAVEREITKSLVNPDNCGYKKTQSVSNFNFFNKSGTTRVAATACQTPKHSQLGYVDAYKRTTEEKNLIPNPKAKPKGARNPFISQLKIC